MDPLGNRTIHINLPHDLELLRQFIRTREARKMSHEEAVAAGLVQFGPEELLPPLLTDEAYWALGKFCFMHNVWPEDLHLAPSQVRGLYSSLKLSLWKTRAYVIRQILNRDKAYEDQLVEKSCIPRGFVDRFLPPHILIKPEKWLKGRRLYQCEVFLTRQINRVEEARKKFKAMHEYPDSDDEKPDWVATHI
jgi:hypothetical protein